MTKSYRHHDADSSPADFGVPEKKYTAPDTNGKEFWEDDEWLKKQDINLDDLWNTQYIPLRNSTATWRRK